MDDWWHTDGISVWREGGSKLTGAEAAKALRESFEKAAERLPFRPLGDDVFFQTVQIDSEHYRLYAVDPGWLDPASRQIRIQVQLPGRFLLRDALSGETISVDNDQVPLTIPAGSLRIIDAAAN